MRRLLIVVDCQKDFIDGALGFEGADKIIPGIIKRIAEYKASGDEVVYTMDTHTPAMKLFILWILIMRTILRLRREEIFL